MSAELIILAGAILGAFAVFLVFQLRKLLIEKQIPLNDLDAVVKALFEIELNKEFFLKLAIGTGIGAFGAFLSLSALVTGAPAGEGISGLLIYGFVWGFAGNGILRVFTMIPEIFTVLNIAKENVSLKRENVALTAQSQALLGQNQALQQSISGSNVEQSTFQTQAEENKEFLNTEQQTPLTATKQDNGTKTV